MKLLAFCVLLLTCIRSGSAAAGGNDSVWYIVQISDPQLGFTEKNRSAEPEIERLGEAIRKINLVHPDIVVITGDFVNSPDHPEQLRQFQELCARFSGTVQVYRIPGNHDLGRPPLEEKIARYQVRYGADRFSVRHKQVRLIGINTCLIREKYAGETEQFRWLEHELEQDTTAARRIVFGHHPFFLSDLSEQENYSNLPAAARIRYDSLFRRQRVAYYFAGHLHDNAAACTGVTRYITTSALGKPLGKTAPGVRFIRIHGNRIRHLYLALDEIPGSAAELEALFASRNGRPVPSFDSYEGLVMCGYQGWFNTPSDGAGRGWFHYRKGSRFAPGHCTVDLWPDITEYPRTYETPFRMADGSKARVFSSYDESTVDLHFRWMQEYGIDGVFLQRFVTTLKTESGRKHARQVLESALKAARKYGRAIAVMYDLSGMKPGDERILQDDWRFICRTYGVNDRRRYTHYLFHRGNPLVGVWGAGFDDHRKYGFGEIRNITGFLKEQGCAVQLGVPAHWRELNGDCLPDTALHRIIAGVDIVHPWFVGRYDEQSYDDFAPLIEDDLEWCRKHGKAYVPTVFPGFSWHNLYPENTSDAIPRNGGKFFWKQIHGAVQAGCRMLYVAMFDEIDEGTAVFKCAHEAPVGASRFVTIEKTLPTDQYLWLTGQAALLWRENKPLSRKLPRRNY